MDVKTKAMIVQLGGGVIKKGLMVAGTALLGKGILSDSSQLESFVSIGMVLAGAGWSFWDEYGRAIVTAQLEVLKAKSLAQAAKLKDNGIKPVTVSEIVEQHATMTPADVTKTIASLPPDVQATVAKVAAVAVALLIFGSLALPQPSIAQVTGNIQADIAAAKRKATADIARTQTAVTGKPAVDPPPIDVWKAIMTAALPDLKYSSALSATAGTPASKIRKQCWDALIAANKQSLGADLKDEAGQPLVKPDPHLFTDVELLAETIDNLSPTGPLFTSCAGAAEMAKMSVLQFINTAVTGAAGFAALGL